MPHTFQPQPDRPPAREALAYLGHIVTSCPTEFFELVAAVMTAGWGLAIAAPSDAFGRIPAYTAFRETGVPELAWGLIALALGLAQLGALAHRRPGLRVLAVALVGAFWGFVAAGVAVSNSFVSTGVTSYGSLAVACALVYVRHRR